MEITPTKTNLIKSKELLVFSRKGFSLLDKKRNVLIREMMELVERAETLNERIESIFREAYEAIAFANISLGRNAVMEIATSVPKDPGFALLYRSVMGTEIPMIKREPEEKSLGYGLYRTNAAIDLAVAKMNEVRELVYELSEVENSIYRLAMEIKKTAKRANSLDKIQIPKYTDIVKYIEEVLEEKEREDFFRLKRVKSKHY